MQQSLALVVSMAFNDYIPAIQEMKKNQSILYPVVIRFISKARRRKRSRQGGKKRKKMDIYGLCKWVLALWTVVLMVEASGGTWLYVCGWKSVSRRSLYRRSGNWRFFSIDRAQSLHPLHDMAPWRVAIQSWHCAPASCRGFTTYGFPFVSCFPP